MKPIGDEALRVVKTEILVTFLDQDLGFRNWVEGWRVSYNV